MNRPLTAVFAALEALLVVGVGIGIPLVPVTLMWAFEYGLQLDWVVFWRGAVDAWLLGHGADVVFLLDPLVATATGLPGAAEPFVVTIAPLGFALITVLLAVRAGRRVGETPHRTIGLLVAIGVFALLSLVVTLTATHPSAAPVFWQAVLLPTFVFALGLGVGSELGRRATRATRSGQEARSVQEAADAARRSPLGALGARLPRVARAAGIVLTAGAGAAAMVIAVSAVALAIVVAVDYGEIVGLYEGVQSGYLGGAALTIGQLAMLPNLVVFAASWFIGPGFAIGTGSAVSPLGTALGPLPALPVLGALPSADSVFAFAGLLVPVLAGFGAAILIRPRLDAVGWRTPLRSVVFGVGIGVVGGVLLAALAWISAGAAGPGRLADVGTPWLAVGGWAAVEIAVPAVLALLVGRLPIRADAPGRSSASDDAPTGPIVVRETSAT